MFATIRSSRAAKLAVATAFTLAAAACGSSNPIAPSTAMTAAPDGQSATFTADTRMVATGLAASGVTPILDSRGNPTCKDLAATYGGGSTWFELKLDRLPNATDAVADQALSVTIANGSANGFNWTATRGIDAVLVKAGNGPHNVYLYSPEAAADSGVVTADKYAISHITFCYDVELVVSKTAAPTFTRDYDWTIAKSVDQPLVALASGADATVNYAVAVTKDAGTDSAWAVSGTIAVTNPHPALAATGVTVTDQMTDHGAVAVSCPSSTIAAGATMTCSYGNVSLNSGAARTNTASATPAAYGFATGTGSAPVSFVTPTTVLDNAVSISDTFPGAALANFSLSASRTFTYTRTLSEANFSACGVATTFGNTATLATDDNATASSSASVVATLTCAPPPPVSNGCTLTQGYWGSHSSKGPAKYDATWATLENAAFYQSGTTYYGVLQLPTKGNAYYILAHQFIAAKLNILKGAAAPAGFNMQAVETFFQTYTPMQIGAMKSGAVRAQAVAWAATLDSYNNGLLNVAHCGS